ncbi:hypothetical protein TNCV_2721761 [Trichonephila clavipes]|nr:hypothetical protein TNCV_2721761 [Trichonephila clavipes]
MQVKCVEAKRPPVGVVWILGKRGARSGATYVSLFLREGVYHREEIADFVQSILRFQECDEDVESWMACDAEDLGFQMLNDDEIVTSEQEESDPVDDDEDEDNNNESSKGPSNADAFSALETAMEWYEQQSECCPTQLLLFKRIRDLAEKRRRCTMVTYMGRNPWSRDIHVCKSPVLPHSNEQGTINVIDSLRYAFM